MARVTVEDCLEVVPNRFALVLLAAGRMRELSQPNSFPMVKCKNKEAVVALREIAAGKIHYAENIDEMVRSYHEEVLYSTSATFTY
jgi:DNA-directed RNA polymerase omega subunit